MVILIILIIIDFATIIVLATIMITKSETFRFVRRPTNSTQTSDMVVTPNEILLYVCVLSIDGCW